MRKLLLACLLMVSGTYAFAQACTPDPIYTEPGVYPDSATGMPSGCIGELYDVTITNVVPVDTCVTQFGPCYDFDSVVIVSFSGLPAGVTYSCYDGENTTSPVDGCAFEGNTSGCVRLEGTPTAAGTYNLTIELTAYMSSASWGSLEQPVTVDWYQIVIEDCNAGAGIEEFANAKYSLYPNPANNKLNIDGLTNGNIQRVEIYTVNGQKVHSQATNANSSLELDVAGFDSGMYIVQLIGDGIIETMKFTKQ